MTYYNRLIDFQYIKIVIP